MATIAAVRIDFRLIHGQVATKWAKILNITKIVVIDRETSQDEFMIELLKMAAPSGVKVVVYDEAKAIEKYQKNQFGNSGRVLVLFKTVDTAYRMYHAGFHYQDLCVGQVPGAEGRKIAYKTVNLNAQELEWLHDIQSNQVHVYCQMVPDEKPADFTAIYKKLID